MNKIIKYGSVVDMPLYNCSALTPDEWSKRDGIIRPIFGIIDLLYGILINILFIPILIVMLKKENFKLSCFKIMSALVLVDMLTIYVNSLATGFLAIKGAVFCTYPTLIYLSGMSGIGLWCCSCMIALVLVINRIIDLSNPWLCDLLFDGYRTYIILLIPLFYGLYFSLFTTAPVFSSKYMTWLYDPLIFPNETNEYSNVSHGFNNIFIVAITCVFYIYFYLSFRNKLKDIELGNSKTDLLSANIFFQSALICVGNQIAAIVYVIMNFVDVPLWLVMFGHISWQIGNGTPVIIYLVMNRTIRNGVLEMFGLRKICNPNPQIIGITIKSTSGH